MRVRITPWLVGVSLLNAGCSVVSDAVYATGHWTRQELNNSRERHRNHQLAAAAWKSEKKAHLDVPDDGDFADGFRAGYAEHLYRGAVQPPPVPPNKYRAARYQTAEGYRAAEAWIAGFARGVEAARAGGFRNWIVGPSSLRGGHGPVVPAELQVTPPPPVPVPAPSSGPVPVPVPAADPLPPPRPVTPAAAPDSPREGAWVPDPVMPPQLDLVREVPAPPPTPTLPPVRGLPVRPEPAADEPTAEAPAPPAVFPVAPAAAAALPAEATPPTTQPVEPSVQPTPAADPVRQAVTVHTPMIFCVVWKPDLDGPRVTWPGSPPAGVAVLTNGATDAPRVGATVLPNWQAVTEEPPAAPPVEWWNVGGTPGEPATPGVWLQTGGGTP